jgi:hypothetical protein
MAEIAFITEKKVCRCLGLVMACPSVSWKKRAPTSIPPGVNNSFLGMIAAYGASISLEEPLSGSSITYITQHHNVV